MIVSRANQRVISIPQVTQEKLLVIFENFCLASKIKKNWNCSGKIPYTFSNFLSGHFQVQIFKKIFEVSRSLKNKYPSWSYTILCIIFKRSLLFLYGEEQTKDLLNIFQILQPCGFKLETFGFAFQCPTKE